MYDLWVMLQLRQKRLVKLLSREATIKTTPFRLIPTSSRGTGPSLKGEEVTRYWKKRSGPQIDSQGRGLINDQVSFERALKFFSQGGPTRVLNDPRAFVFDCGIEPIN